MDTTFVIATKDLIKAGRGVERLYWQALSIDAMSVKCELLIIDGSLTAENNIIRKRLKGTSAKVIHLPQDVLNLPKLWNQGVQMAAGEWMHISGADFIYSPQFMGEVAGVRKEDRLVMCKVWELPRMNITKDRISKWNWPPLKEFFAYKPRLANGIQHATKELFAKVPYDERMLKLGGMDNLQEYKCIKEGYDCYWWEQRHVLHQWHKISQMKMGAQFNENQKIIRDYLK